MIANRLPIVKMIIRCMAPFKTHINSLRIFSKTNIVNSLNLRKLKMKWMLWVRYQPLKKREALKTWWKLLNLFNRLLKQPIIFLKTLIILSLKLNEIRLKKLQPKIIRNSLYSKIHVKTLRLMILSSTQRLNFKILLLTIKTLYHIENKINQT